MKDERLEEAGGRDDIEGHTETEVLIQYPYHSIYAHLHFALAILAPMSQRVTSPFIPSSHLTKGRRSVFLTERV